MLNSKDIEIAEELDELFRIYDPIPVIISSICCKLHGFNYVNVPREVEGGPVGYSLKCPLKGCGAGV